MGTFEGIWQNQDVHSQETYYFIRDFVDVQFMHTFRPERGQTVDKLWTNCGTTCLGRGTAYLEHVKTKKICCKIVDPAPKRGQQFGFQSGYSWWHKNSNAYNFKAMISLDPSSGLFWYMDFNGLFGIEESCFLGADPVVSNQRRSNL